MINVIVPITENVEGFKDFIQRYNGPAFKFYIGVTRNLKDSLGEVVGADIFVYENNINREVMINSLHAAEEKEEGKLVVLRRPLTDEEFKQLLTSESEVTCFRKKHNKFVGFFKKITRWILRSLFALTYFDDISAVAYSENLFNLMSAVPNLSMATRINRYVGVNVEEIETTSKPARKIYNKAANVLWLVFAILFFAASIFNGVYLFVIYDRMWVIFVLLILFWWLVATTLLLLITFRFVRTVAVGDLDYDKAEPIMAVIARKAEPATPKAEKESKKKTPAKKTAKKTAKTSKKEGK